MVGLLHFEVVGLLLLAVAAVLLVAAAVLLLVAVEVPRFDGCVPVPGAYVPETGTPPPFPNGMELEDAR